MLSTFLMDAPLGMPAVCGLCLPATPPILSPCFGFNTRQQKALRSRVAGAQNCKQTAPGIAVAGLPPSMNRGQKKTRINASARAGYRCLGVLRLRCFGGRFTFACQ